MTPLIPLHLSFVLLLLAKVFSGQTLKKQLSLALEIERRSVLAKADPVAGQQIDVNMWFNLLFIIGLDERQQILTTSGWLDLWWNDDRYVWNSTEYGGIESIMVLHEKVRACFLLSLSAIFCNTKHVEDYLLNDRLTIIL